MAEGQSRVLLDANLLFTHEVGHSMQTRSQTRARVEQDPTGFESRLDTGEQLIQFADTDRDEQGQEHSQTEQASIAPTSPVDQEMDEPVRDKSRTRYLDQYTSHTPSFNHSSQESRQSQILSPAVNSTPDHFSPTEDVRQLNRSMSGQTNVVDVSTDRITSTSAAVQRESNLDRRNAFRPYPSQDHRI